MFAFGAELRLFPPSKRFQQALRTQMVVRLLYHNPAHWRLLAMHQPDLSACRNILAPCVGSLSLIHLYTEGTEEITKKPGLQENSQ